MARVAVAKPVSTSVEYTLECAVLFRSRFAARFPKAVQTIPLSSLSYVKPAPTEEPPMREFIRPVAAALSVACLAASMAVMSADSALAQGKPAPSNQMAPAQAAPPPLKQMALTEKQIEAMLAADQEMDPVIDKMTPNTKPDPKITAQLEAIAKKNGFASYDDYNNVSDNISLVFSGI